MDQRREMIQRDLKRQRKDKDQEGNNMQQENDKCVNSRLWHACAGELVEIPPANSIVYYIPQGHAEHAQTPVNLNTPSPSIPPLLLCLVTSVEYKAEPQTDDIFARISLLPLTGKEVDSSNQENVPASQEKPAFKKKNLTQSDANNGGGFSVPKDCAESLFPPLDYSSRPPIQILTATDVHGMPWTFRHIYRGTPQRHLLTTGWSTFLNKKKLVTGDLIIFLRNENGDLCVGFRRARVKKKGTSDGRPPPLPHSCFMGSHHHVYGVVSSYWPDNTSRGQNNNAGASTYGGEGVRLSGRVSAESVMEAATLAVNGKPFEVTYYPAAGTPEFVVRASKVRAAMAINWRPDMRIKMALELEDFSKTSWFNGVVSSVQVSYPERWPKSPWRLLQVSWDEGSGVPEELKSVNPWQVEPASNLPPIHISPMPLPGKNIHIPPQHPGLQSPDSPSYYAIVNPQFISSRRSSLWYLPTASAVAGIQGARHFPPQAINYGNLPSGIFHAGFQQPERVYPTPPTISREQPVITSNFSLTTKGTDPYQLITTNDEENHKGDHEISKTVTLRLFGTTIYADENLFLGINSCSADVSSSDTEDAEVLNKRDESPSDQWLSRYLYQRVDNNQPATNYQAAHCKVFMESEDVGRVIDLSSIVSPEDLYHRLSNMFGVHTSDLINTIDYRDATAVEVKHASNEPFFNFLKKVKRLTILKDPRGNSRES